MNRLDRIRLIFAELDRSLSDQLTPHEMLIAAAGLAGLFEPTVSSPGKFSLRTGGVPFDQWSVDVAMADGGWRVMLEESELVHSLYDDERDAISNEIEVKHWFMEHAA